MNALRALVLLPLLAAGAPAAATVLGGAAAPAQSDSEFMEKFRQAMKVGATDEMNRLLRQHHTEALNTIVEICEFIAGGSNEKLENEIAALRRSWNEVHKTKFADNFYEYVSLLRPEYKETRGKLKAQYTATNKLFRQAEEAKEPDKLPPLGLTMKDLGEGFASIGDHYYAALCYRHWARANDEPLRGDDADLKSAHDAYARVVEELEAIDLKDADYESSKGRRDSLAQMGFGDPAKAAPGAAKPAGEPAAGATLTLTTTFELVPDMEAYRRPIYINDGIYPVWIALNLRDTGSSTEFPGVEGSPKVLRTGAAEVSVDADRDGTGDVPVPITGNLVPVETTIGLGDEARPWGFLSAVGADRDTYNGIQYNLSPSKEFMVLYVAPAASVVADLGGVSLRVLDDNLDGVYGSAPREWAHVGLLEDALQKDVDSIVVGESKVAIPWSEYVKVGESWYQLEPEGGGTTLKATPLEGIPTGTLKLDLKGVEADWVVVRGAPKSRYENAYFLVTKQGVEVPAGAYELFQGQVAQGKKMQRAKALMLPGDTVPRWTVAEGETATLELGAPFGFTFETTQDEDSVTIVGKSIAVTGRGGETYQRLWNCAPRPEASYREEGKKRGSKGEDMRGAETQEELAEDFAYGWFPKDLTLEKDPGNVEVQLVEKKNKLFGKIESDWR